MLFRGHTERRNAVVGLPVDGFDEEDAQPGAQAGTGSANVMGYQREYQQQDLEQRHEALDRQQAQRRRPPRRAGRDPGLMHRVQALGETDVASAELVPQVAPDFNGVRQQPSPNMLRAYTAAEAVLPRLQSPDLWDMQHLERARHLQRLQLQRVQVDLQRGFDTRQHHMTATLPQTPFGLGTAPPTNTPAELSPPISPPTEPGAQRSFPRSLFGALRPGHATNIARPRRNRRTSMEQRAATLTEALRQPYLHPESPDMNGQPMYQHNRWSQRTAAGTEALPQSFGSPDITSGYLCPRRRHGNGFETDNIAPFGMDQYHLMHQQQPGTTQRNPLIVPSRTSSVQPRRGAAAPRTSRQQQQPETGLLDRVNLHRCSADRSGPPRARAA